MALRDGRRWLPGPGAWGAAAPALGLGAAALCGAAFIAAFPEGPLGARDEATLKALLGAGVLALFATSTTRAARERPRARTALAVVAALLAVWAWPSFGRFHHPQFVHWWEQFHYQLGSRYFPELGYDGLYAASIAAQHDSAPGRLVQPRFRDLRVNRVRDTDELLPHIAHVRERFTPERWRAFVADHATFLRRLPLPYLADMRRDHGYNATPAWTALARALNGGVPLTPASLRAFACVDLALMAVAFAALLRVFGAWRACLALAVFGLGYGPRYQWIGGAFLRLDWLAALALGLCALARGRALPAGAAFGYAAAVRLFPTAFLLGPAVLGVRALVRGERPVAPLRLAAGFALALVVGLGAGALAGRGPSAWTELAERMQLYQVSWARNSVGLPGLVLYGGEAARRAVAAPDADADPWGLQREDVGRLRAERWIPLRAAQLALLGLAVLAAWRATPTRAAAYGMVAVFALTQSAGYYWGMAMLAPLAGGAGVGLALLGLSAACFGLELVLADNLVLHSLLSWGLLAIFSAWLAPDAWRTVVDARDRLSAGRDRAASPR